MWYHVCMSSEARITKIVEKMKAGQANIPFADLTKVCDHYFGQPRQSGSSHRVYRTPWAGDPRVNIQNAKGKAKPYQVKQVLAAVDKINKEGK